MHDTTRWPSTAVPSGRWITTIRDHAVLSDRAYGAIREAILSLELPPGAALKERSLAADLGISKTPIRDALGRLAQDGLVTISRFRSAIVWVPTVTDVEEIYQMREALEPLAVRLAVPQLDATDLEQLAALLQTSHAALVEHDYVALSKSNRGLHSVFIRKSGNERLASTLTSLNDQQRLISMLAWAMRDSAGIEYDQHAAILHAATHGDAERAGRLMAEHIRQCKQAYVVTWGQRLIATAEDAARRETEERQDGERGQRVPSGLSDLQTT